MKPIPIGWVILLGLAMGLFPSASLAAQTLSEGEMDRVIAGLFLDAEGNINISAAATAVTADAGIAVAGSTGGGNGLASVPVNNAVVVKDTGKGDNSQGRAGSVAIGHNGAQPLVDHSINSDNRNQIHVDADGDSAAAFGAGATATQKGAPHVERDKPEQPPGTVIIPVLLPGAQQVGGSPQRTGIITSWNAKEKSHGNKGSVRDANEESETTAKEELALSNEAQKDADALFLANSAKGQVGSGSNFVSEANSSKATGLLGNLNFSSGIEANDQTVMNFSEGSATTRSISVTPVSSATATPFTVRTSNVYTTTNTGG